MTDNERQIKAQQIMDEKEKRFAEFDAWASKQKNPPYCMDLNKYRCNEGNRWYKYERTQHAAEGFVAAMSICRGEAAA